MEKKDNRGTGRSLVLSTARRLFLVHGIAHVGVKEITSAAGVAKMTLYNNFDSKNALINEVYQGIADDLLNKISKHIASMNFEADKILSLFEHIVLDDIYHRGCPMHHAILQSIETHGEVFEIVQTYKARLRLIIFNNLNIERHNRDELADQILMLLEGATIQYYLRSAIYPLASARKAVLVLLSSHS